MDVSNQRISKKRSAISAQIDRMDVSPSGILTQIVRKKRRLTAEIHPSVTLSSVSKKLVSAEEKEMDIEINNAVQNESEDELDNFFKKIEKEKIDENDAYNNASDNDGYNNDGSDNDGYNNDGSDDDDESLYDANESDISNLIDFNSQVSYGFSQTPDVSKETKDLIHEYKKELV